MLCTFCELSKSGLVIDSKVLKLEPGSLISLFNISSGVYTVLMEKFESGGNSSNWFMGCLFSSL